MSPVRSVLTPEPQPLWPYFLLAFSLHVFLVFTLMCLNVLDLFSPRKPLLDVDRSMEVSLVQLKHTDTMPTRATVAPRPKGESEPVAVPKPAPTPPPVQSDLAYQTEEAPPAPQGDPERDAALEEARRKALMDAALADAMEGSRDREATDPSSDATESISTGGAGMRAPPELIKWKAGVEDLFRKNFKPLPTIVAANPGIQCEVNVDFDPASGRVTGYDIHTTSGNSSYDAAAERAVQAVPSIPPPPAQFTDLVGSRLTITFTPPN